MDCLVLGFRIELGADQHYDDRQPDPNHECDDGAKKNRKSCCNYRNSPRTKKTVSKRRARTPLRRRRNFSRAREFAEVEPSPPCPPRQMRGFPRPRPLGIRAGFSFGERQTLGTRLSARALIMLGRGREAGWAALQGRSPHADNRRPGSNSRPDRLLDSSAYNSVLLRSPSFSKQIDSPWR